MKKLVLFTVLAWGLGLILLSRAQTLGAQDKPAPMVQVPPRPQPSQALLSDAELALPPAAIPSVPDAWRADVIARAQPLRSLFSDDFSDLQFLKPLLAGKRLVQLGESGHGVAEFNWMKVRLIKFLHQQMGFDVLAFESPMTACEAADGMLARAEPDMVMRTCIFSVWHTDEMLPLFDYLKLTRANGQRLRLAGFDVQNSSGSQATRRIFETLLQEVAPQEVALVAQHEQQLQGFQAENAGELESYYSGLLQTLQAQREPLFVHFKNSPALVDLAIQEARSRVQLVRHRAGKGSAIRDAGMADNLDFLLDRRFPGHKIIVWAHNAHVAYLPVGKGVPKPMGQWLTERRRQQVYTVGLYMGRGAAANNAGHVYPISGSTENSLEAVLAQAGYAYSFFDLVGGVQDGSSWTQTALPGREWGNQPITLLPAKTYDGLLYIDTVTPPSYLASRKQKEHPVGALSEEK